MKDDDLTVPRAGEGVIEKWHTEASFVDENPVHMANDRYLGTVRRTHLPYAIKRSL